MPKRANAQTKGMTMATRKTTSRKKQMTAAEKATRAKQQAAVKTAEDAQPKPITFKKAQELIELGLITRERFEQGLNEGTIKPQRGGGFLADDAARRAVTRLWKVVANWNATDGSEIGATAMLRIQYANGAGKDGEAKTRSIAVNDKKLGVVA